MGSTIEEADSELLGEEVQELFTQEDAADAESGSSRGEGSARKKFNVSDDLILLHAVSVVKPWEAAAGTTNGIMKSFDEVAKLRYMNDGFIADKQGPALRTRFSHLLRQHQKQQLLSMRSSGTTEEHGEREFLLVDITTRMNDAKELQGAKKHQEKQKQKGIESSGELLRRLAMGELEKQSSSSETSDGSGEKGSRSRKRAALNAGRKTTKREKLEAMTDKIAASIENMDRDYAEKYGYLSKRMEYEKEEAEKQRAHELMMEERREAAERARDDRHAAAERDREKFMLRLLEMALGKIKDDKSE